MKTDLTITVAGTEYPVRVSGSDGTFRVDLGELGELKAGSFADLKKQAAKVKIPFTLPFTYVDGTGFRHGEVTGIHAGNGNLLLRWDNGETSQMARWGGGTYIPRVDGEDETRLRALVTARNTARQAMDEFVKPRAFDSLSRAAEAARDRAAQPSQDQETGEPS